MDLSGTFFFALRSRSNVQNQSHESDARSEISLCIRALSYCHLGHPPCILTAVIGAIVYCTKRNQTIFPYGLGLVTLISMEENQDGCTMIKV